LDLASGTTGALLEGLRCLTAPRPLPFTIDGYGKAPIAPEVHPETKKATVEEIQTTFGECEVFE